MKCETHERNNWESKKESMTEIKERQTERKKETVGRRIHRKIRKEYIEKVERKI